MTTLYIVRHGESMANHENYFAGQQDVALTDLGLRQAECTARFLQKLPLSAVYSSDLRRAADTAAAIARPHGLSVTRRADLREINGGLWERKGYEEIMRRFPEDYRVWKNRVGLSQCTGGETVAQVQARAAQAVTAIAQSNEEKAVCLVAHGLVIRALEAFFTAVPLEEMEKIPFVANASVTKVSFAGGKWRLEKRDSHAHLEDMVTFVSKDV